MWPLFLVIMSPIHNHAGEDGQGAERLAGAIRQLHGHEGRLSNFAAAAAPSTTTTTVAIMGFASTAVGRQTVRGSRWMLCGCVGLCGWGGGGGGTGSSGFTGAKSFKSSSYFTAAASAPEAPRKVSRPLFKETASARGDPVSGAVAV